MVMFWRLLFLKLSFLSLLSCAYSIHQVHVSDFVAPTGSSPKIVKAEAKQRVILGLAFDTDYANQAYRRIAGKCVGGVIDGITSRHSTDLGFLNWTNRLYIRGICRSLSQKS